MPPCHWGLTGKNTPSTRRDAWAWACPGMPEHSNLTHVPVFLKSRVRSVFLHKTSHKAAWRLLQLCIAALAGRCWALGGLHPRTYSGALTRTRRRRSFFAARQHDLEKVRFPRKIQLLSLPHPVFHLVITPEVVAAAAEPLGWEGEAGDHG